MTTPNYRTRLHGDKTGRGTIGTAEHYDGCHWFEIGRTKCMRTYPMLVRARQGAENICRRHAKAHGERRPEIARC